MNRFPFRFLPAAPAVAPPAPAPPPLWTTVTGAAERWIGSAPVALVPRFEHLYPQTVASFGQVVTFAHRVQTEFATRIGTGDQLPVQSAITV